MMLCVLSSCCMYVCVCVFDFGYHYALLYQGFSVELVIFLFSSCSGPEVRARQILRERAFGRTPTLTLLL